MCAYSRKFNNFNNKNDGHQKHACFRWPSFLLIKLLYFLKYAQNFYQNIICIKTYIKFHKYYLKKYFFLKNTDFMRIMAWPLLTIFAFSSSQASLKNILKIVSRYYNYSKKKWFPQLTHSVCHYVSKEETFREQYCSILFV